MHDESFYSAKKLLSACVYFLLSPTYKKEQATSMQEKNRAKRIMQSYFGKKFSRYGRSLFGRWLKAEEDKELKTTLLQALWEQQYSSAITDETRSDWDKLRHRLPTRPSPAVMPFYRQWLKYAAVAGLMILSAGATLWLTKQESKPVNHAMTTFFVPYGESRLVVLADSSTVWLNAGSLLVSPASFDKMDSRTVYLTGEASFSAYKDPEKPFIVRTIYADIRALGTIFTVKAYPNDSCTTTTLEEGLVSVCINGMDREPSILKPNQQMVYKHHSETVSIREIDIHLHKMERKGYLIVENCPFSELMVSLERKFNITIHYNSMKFAKGSYNVKFAPEETLEDVLRVVGQLTGMHYTVNGNVVVIN